MPDGLDLQRVSTGEGSPDWLSNHIRLLSSSDPVLFGRSNLPAGIQC